MQFTLNTVKSLQPGQSVQLGWRELQFDFPFRQHNGAMFSPPDNLLESILGSAFEYGYNINPADRTVTFFRLERPIEEFDTFVYVSPDRRQYYSFNGSLYRRNSKPYLR